MVILIFDTRRRLSVIISPYRFTVPFQWRLLIFIGKNLWRRVLEASKKQVPLKSYFLEIRIDSVNQIMKNKEKVTQNTSILTIIPGREIPCVYIYVYQIIKNRGPGLYNFLHHADNRKYFSGLSLTQNRREGHVLLGERRGKNLDMFLLRKGNFIMINEFRYGQTWKFGHLHLVYHFTVPLSK